MAMTTTTRSGQRYVKPFSFSWTKIKNFEVCPKRHYEVDIAKTTKEPENESLAHGNVVHEIMAKRCGPLREAIPQGYPDHYEKWAAKVVNDGTGEFLVEDNIAINKNFQVVDNFAKDAWCRVKLDFVRVIDNVALAADWKTGAIKDEGNVQLALVAMCLFAKYPQLQAVRSCYVWLKEDAETSETFYRDDIPTVWRAIWPRIEALESAHVNMNYPPKPGGMCIKYCKVTACPFNGKGSR